MATLTSIEHLNRDLFPIICVEMGSRMHKKTDLHVSKSRVVSYKNIDLDFDAAVGHWTTTSS